MLTDIHYRSLSIAASNAFVLMPFETIHCWVTHTLNLLIFLDPTTTTTTTIMTLRIITITPNHLHHPIQIVHPHLFLLL